MTAWEGDLFGIGVIICGAEKFIPPEKIVCKNFSTALENRKSFLECFFRQFVFPSYNPRSGNGATLFICI
jgi:hypothetical protein